MWPLVACYASTSSSQFVLSPPALSLNCQSVIYPRVKCRQSFCLSHRSSCKRRGTPLHSGVFGPSRGPSGRCTVLARGTTRLQPGGWALPCSSSCPSTNGSWTWCSWTTVTPSHGTRIRTPAVPGPPGCCSSPLGGNLKPPCECGLYAGLTFL